MILKKERKTMDRTALKAMAKEQIRGNVWMFLLCTLIVGALSAVIPGGQR